MAFTRSVHETLKKYQLVDGFDVVFDMEKSQGVWLHDSVTQEKYLDCFTCFASWPIGYNHPMMTEPEFFNKISKVSINNPVNSDLYTREMAEFVEMFATYASPDGFNNHFWVAGGALAIENALKTAFDWKARKLGRKIGDTCEDLVIIHLREAFHGRSGYTMSLTNTDPVKTGLFPKFDWPRIHNPCIEYDLDGNVSNDIAASESQSKKDLDAAFSKHGDRVAGIIVEPMQGEGGDNHFRSEFLQMLRDYSDNHDCLLIFDEIQTGVGITGKMWAHQNFNGVIPDIISFGKKTQCCGIFVGERIDEVDENVFNISSRLNSTWGGNLADMVRFSLYLEIIEEEGLVEKAAESGKYLLKNLEDLQNEYSHLVSNSRGRGLFCAFDLPDGISRDKMANYIMDEGAIVLGSGVKSIRFRPHLNISRDEIDLGVDMIRKALGRF